MHVHFDEFKIADTDDGIADLHQPFLQLVYVRKGGLLFQIDDKKFGAVSKFDLPEIEIDDIGIVAEYVLFRLGRIRKIGYVVGDLFAGDDHEEAAVHAQEPHAARVDHPRLFENGKKFGRFGQRLFTLFDDVGQKSGEISVFRAGCFGKFAHETGDGEHRALFGLGHCGIGDFGAVFHGLCKNFDGDLFAIFDFRTHAPEKLRKDDARISAGPFERALGNGVADFR